jgi:RNA polymerase-binding transcription factor DksA
MLGYCSAVDLVPAEVSFVALAGKRSFCFAEVIGAVMGQEAATIQRALARIQDQIIELEKSLEEKPDYGLGEGDPAIVRWELNRALLQQNRRRAADLEQALSRLSQGNYGTCEQCGEPIHPDRLAVLPGVRRCIRCAQTDEAT